MIKTFLIKIFSIFKKWQFWYAFATLYHYFIIVYSFTFLLFIVEKFPHYEFALKIFAVVLLFWATLCFGIIIFKKKFLKA